MKKRLLSSIMAGCLLLSVTACDFNFTLSNGQRELTESELKKIQAAIPDYGESNLQFDFFAYSAVSDGNWVRADGTQFYIGEDLRTVENFELYNAAGFTFMHPQGTAAIQAADRGSFVYKTSELKQLMDTCAEANVKMVVPDYRLYGLVDILTRGLDAYGLQDESLIAAFESTSNGWGLFVDGEYSTEVLDSLIIEFMGEYSKHPAYYGNVLPDEPNCEDKTDGTPYDSTFEAYGIVYKAVKRLYPDAFLLCNVLPPAGFKASYLGEKHAPTEEELAIYPDSLIGKQMATWTKYIKTYLECTGIDYLMYDQYPVHSEGMHFTYIAGLQIAAELCKEKGIDLYLVTQSTTKSDTRALDEKATVWLNNMLLGMGVKKMGYYRYYDSGYDYLEGSSFVNYFGEPNRLYYIYQELFKQNQRFAPTVLSFDYSTSNVYYGEENVYAAQCTNNAMVMGNLTKVDEVAVDKEALLVSELKDEANGRYMYMIQNVVDPQFTTSKSWQTVTLKFNETYKYALVWKNGEKTVVKLKENSYTVSQHPSEAVYVIPFNA